MMIYSSFGDHILADGQLVPFDFQSPYPLFYFDKLNQKSFDNSIDLQDLLILFKIKKCDEELELLENEKLLDNWKRTFSIVPQPIPENVMFSKKIIFKYLNNRNIILEKILNKIKNIIGFEKIIQFYIKNIHIFNILKNLSYSIITKTGPADVAILFAENFRLKSKADFLNLFNIQKSQRDIIIPQRPGDFLYAIDFKQFEYRSFLMVSDAPVNFSREDIYQDLAEQIKKDRETTKIMAIKYLYSNIEDGPMAQIIDKNRLLAQINDDIWYWKEFPVFISREWDNNKIIHTIVQTIAQYIFLCKLCNLLKFIEKTEIKFVFPLHDSIILSISDIDIDKIPKIKEILEDDVFKVKEYIGLDYAHMEQLWT